MYKKRVRLIFESSCTRLKTDFSLLYTRQQTDTKINNKGRSSGA